MASVLAYSFIIYFLIYVAQDRANSTLNPKKQALVSLADFSLAILFGQCISGLAIFCDLANKRSIGSIATLTASAFIAVIIGIYFKSNNLQAAIDMAKSNINEIKCALNRYSRREKIIIFLILLILILTSIGPITSSDVSRVYAGYPLEFWRVQSIYLDTLNPNQGLLSIDNFAYISFFREGNTWLARGFVHAIALSSLCAAFILQRCKLSTITALLCIPIYVSFLTEGKSPFLANAAIAILLITFAETKKYCRATLIIAATIIGISIKISDLLVSLPVFAFLTFHLIQHLRKRASCKWPISSKKLNISSLSYAIILIITAIIAISCFYIKWKLTGVPTYPIFTRFFQPNSSEHLFLFEDSVRQYKRSILMPLTLFIPTSLGLIGTVIGPYTGYHILQNLLKAFKSKSIFYRNICLVGAFQILLMLLLGQGRADYYFTPIAIILYAGSKFKQVANKKNGQNRNKFVFFLLVSQLALFLAVTLGSIFITASATRTYDYTMKKYAYGYNTHHMLKNHLSTSSGNSLDLRNNRALIYEQADLIPFGLVKSKFCDKFNLLSECLIDNNIKTAIGSSADEISTILKPYNIHVNNEECSSLKSNIGSRNPFNRKESMISICSINYANKK